MKLYELLPKLTFKIWGGDKLLGLRAPEMIGKNKIPLGETWEVSRHPDGPCKTRDGVSLDTIFTDEELPYLVKFIDTSENLSIQVHPGDEYSRKYEQQRGKTECWIILDASEGAGIFLGLKEGVSKESFTKQVEEGDKVDSLLNFYPVKRGDFFVVPSGAIHAIGAGVTLVEVQQSSGVTYRVWDWNRLQDGKPRELHIKKANDVINFDRSSNCLDYFKFQQSIFNLPSQDLLMTSDFNLHYQSLCTGEEITLNSKKRCLSLTVLEGSVLVDSKVISENESIVIGKNEAIKVEGNDPKSHFIWVC